MENERDDGVSKGENLGFTDPEHISRKAFLQRLGKYSAAAAFALGSSSLFFNSCKMLGLDGGDDGGDSNSGSSFNDAKTLSINQSTDITVSDDVYYSFTASESLYYLVIGSVTGSVYMDAYDQDQLYLGGGELITGDYWEFTVTGGEKYYIKLTTSSSPSYCTVEFLTSDQFSQWTGNWTGDWTGDWSADWTGDWTGDWSGDWFGQYSCSGFGCSCSCQTYGVY